MTLVEKVKNLPYWKQNVEPLPLHGGITNTNFTVLQGDEKFVVRVGEDIPIHGVMRFHEQAASRAAFSCGISPEVVYAELGFLIMRFLEGKTLKSEDVRQDAYLEQILPLLKKCHQQMPYHMQGPILYFWVFYMIRDYAATLKADNSRMIPGIPRFLEISKQLESDFGSDSIVFGHNDLLAANLIESDDRLWLIDWDYAGFTSPLFDLSNLASNNLLSSKQEVWLLENYYEKTLTESLWKRYHAIKCASLLREAMWSMVSESHSTLDFDYVGYSDENMKRFEIAFAAYQGR